MCLLRIAYPNIFTSTSACKSKVNTPFTCTSYNASNNNIIIYYNDAGNTKIESYTYSESDDYKRSVSSALL